uniref:Integrator complex subunit 11 n=1 Tax=Podarcis muralis TaxID=64176 RepID=A0A670JBZ1_PODMU
MPEIKVTPLGAGQDVGRSCILVSIAGKNVMLDCGMHMGYNDDRRFPDFSYITQNGRLTDFLDCVIISHFHLDHCGALPYFSEMVGYDGPIYMTHPTKAICPILLEDFRKITVDKKGETNFFTSQMIKDCMKKVVAVHLHQTVQVDDELEIKAYYAGHVLGAAMFQIKVGCESVVYTGDYNMTPDRHLGAAWIDKCRPDLLISESTYATTIRDSKRCRERDFLKKVHEAIERGGKVLIPVFALGRAQELCILLETFWERMNLKAPIYFSTGLTEKANHYYKLFITWTNQKIRKTFVQRNMFEFKHIKAFDRAFADNPGPMVVFATPGMLHAGQSLQIFKKWAGNEKNMVIMPGYCVQGTVGHKILGGHGNVSQEGPSLEVKMQVEYMSFSAHADAKGIMQLIRQAEPRNVLLVHGEAKKMEFLKQKIEQEFHVTCHMPANGETVTVHTNPNIPVDVSLGLLKRELTIGKVLSVQLISTIFKKYYLLNIFTNLYSRVQPKDHMSFWGRGRHPLLDTPSNALLYPPSWQKKRVQRWVCEGCGLGGAQRPVKRGLEGCLWSLGPEVSHPCCIDTGLGRYLQALLCVGLICFHVAAGRWLGPPPKGQSQRKQSHAGDQESHLSACVCWAFHVVGQIFLFHIRC